MQLKSKLIEGRFLKRYKRFFADIELIHSEKREVVVAHVANTGSLKSCNSPGSLCRVAHHDDPERKLKYSLEMMHTETSWVGVNTSLPNQLVYEMWQTKKNPEWKIFDCAQREVKISAESRVDMVLWSSKNGFAEEKISKYDFLKSKAKFHFVEVKNVTYAENGVSMFPDAETTRGQKHITELVKLIEHGHTAEIVFVVQREDCKKFAPAKEIDPTYAEMLTAAIKKGLVISPYPCRLTDHSVDLLTSKLALQER